MDYNSGKILFERDADHQIYPASMTKIMTAIIVFDLLNKRIKYNFQMKSLYLKMLGECLKVVIHRCSLC